MVGNLTSKMKISALQWPPHRHREESLICRKKSWNGNLSLLGRTPLLREIMWSQKFLKSLFFVKNVGCLLVFCTPCFCCCLLTDPAGECTQHPPYRKKLIAQHANTPQPLHPPMPYSHGQLLCSHLLNKLATKDQNVLGHVYKKNNHVVDFLFSMLIWNNCDLI